MIDPVSDPVWYPFTQMKLSPPPIHIDRAEGCTLYAANGKTYIDAVSSWWVNIHGHSNPYIARRIAEQAGILEHVIFAGFTHSPAVDLARKLISVLPGMSRIFYSDNGSTAVEVAIKMALQYWHNQAIYNRTKLIAFENAYHGDTFGAMSVGAKSAFNAAFEKNLFKADFIPVPERANIREVKEKLEALLNTGEHAAFIFEPLVQGAGGMIMHESAHLDELIGMAQRKHVLCIADEVMTGFGRTGKNFAIDYLQHRPDLICLSKGITGGFMPLGVTACTQKIFDMFYSDETGKTFFHGHSYTANPLACAAAGASLDLLLSETCQLQIREITSSHARFAASLQHESFVRHVRQLGTIIAFELNTKESSSYFNRVRDEVYRFCLEHGVLLRPLGNVLYMMPPYCITRDELEKIYGVIRKLLQTLKNNYELI